MELWAIAIIIIFLATLVIMITEKLDRTATTISGAILVFVILSFEGITFEEILSFVDFPTIMTMFGVLVAGMVVNDAGLFQWIAIKLVKLTKGEPTFLFMLLTMLTVLLSSILTILAASIIIFRLTISITRALDIDPKPFIISEAVVVGIGGATSLVAAPSSILIAQFANLNFAFFIIHTLPIAILLGIINTFLLKKQVDLPTEISDIRKAVLMEFDEWSVVPDKNLFYLSAIVLTAMVVSFLFFPAYLVAFVGGIIFILIKRQPFNEIVREMEWGDLFFFIGIFIIVGGVEHTGVLQAIGRAMGSMSPGNPLVPLLIIVWFTGITSGFLDGVTIALTFIPIIDELVASGGFTQYFTVFVIALILSTNFGGCFTPIGTPANLILISLGKSEGIDISFAEFLKYGLITVTVNLIVESLYVTLLFALV